MRFLIALLVASASPAHAANWITVVENETLAISMDIDSYDERLGQTGYASVSSEELGTCFLCKGARYDGGLQGWLWTGKSEP